MPLTYKLLELDQLPPPKKKQKQKQKQKHIQAKYHVLYNTIYTMYIYFKKVAFIWRLKREYPNVYVFGFFR